MPAEPDAYDLQEQEYRRREAEAERQRQELIAAQARNQTLSGEQVKNPVQRWFGSGKRRTKRTKKQSRRTKNKKQSKRSRS